MAKQPKPKSAKAAATPGLAEIGDRTVATLMVSEKQLDEMFLNWPLEDKISCVQNHLDGMED